MTRAHLPAAASAPTCPPFLMMQHQPEMPIVAPPQHQEHDQEEEEKERVQG